MDPDVDQKLDTLATTKPGTRPCPLCGLEVSVTQTSCPADGTPLDEIFESGSILDGKYEFIELVGSGGMGVIYRARQIVLNKLVAIKMLHTDMINDRALKRFQREGKAASALSHPNIIAIYDYSVTPHKQPYLVMEYVEGQSLEQKIQEEGLLDIDFTVQAMIQVCDGLSHAHKHGILHRDLKPSNILIVKNSAEDARNNSIDGYTMKILDFGIAKITDDSSTASMALTKTGDTIGSPLYMSPEQCFGKEMDKRSELYALGCTIYECLTGLPPFVGPTLANIVVKISNEDPPPLKDASLGKDFPPALEGIVNRLLRKNPDERYQSADELKWDLQNFRENPPVTRSTRVVVPPVRPRANRFIAILSAVICLVALLLVKATVEHFNQRVPATVRPVMPVKVTGFDGITGGDSGNGSVGTVNNVKAAVRQWVMRNPNANTINMGYWEIADEDLEPLKDESECLSLNLPGNSIKGPGLKYLSSMHKLSALRIDKNDIDDDALSYLAKLTRLQSLNLKQTHVKGSGLSNLQHMQLAVLDLSTTPVQPLALGGLKELKTLANANFNSTAFNNACVGYLSSMNNLQVLDLSHTRVTNEGVLRLAKFDQIRDLCLTSDAIDDRVMKGLAHMKNLNRLDVSGTSVTADGIRQLASSKSLLTVYCAGCSGDVISAAAEIKAHLPNCQVIPSPRPGT